MLNLNKEVYAGRIIYMKSIGHKVSGTYLVLASDQNYRDQNGKFHTHTNFERLIAWRFMSKQVNKYGIGDNVYIEAKTVTNQYTGKDNKKHYSNNHIVTKANLIERSHKNQAKVDQNSHKAQNIPARSAVATSNADNKKVVTDNDLPF